MKEAIADSIYPLVDRAYEHFNAAIADRPLRLEAPITMSLDIRLRKTMTMNAG